MIEFNVMVNIRIKYLPEKLIMPEVYIKKPSFQILIMK